MVLHRRGEPQGKRGTAEGSESPRTRERSCPLALGDPNVSPKLFPSEKRDSLSGAKGRKLCPAGPMARPPKREWVA